MGLFEDPPDCIWSAYGVGAVQHACNKHESAKFRLANIANVDEQRWRSESQARTYPFGYPISAVHSVHTKLDDACGGRPPVPGMAALQNISLTILAFQNIDLHNNDCNEESHQDQEYSHSIQVRHCAVEQTNTHAGDPCRNLHSQLVMFPNSSVQVPSIMDPVF